MSLEKDVIKITIELEVQGTETIGAINLTEEAFDWMTNRVKAGKLEGSERDEYHSHNFKLTATHNGEETEEVF